MNKPLASLELSMPGSDLEHHAHLLLEHLDPTEAEGDGEEDLWMVMEGVWPRQAPGHREQSPEAGMGQEQRGGSDHYCPGLQSGRLSGILY